MKKLIAALLFPLASFASGNYEVVCFLPGTSTPYINVCSDRMNSFSGSIFSFDDVKTGTQYYSTFQCIAASPSAMCQ